MTEDYGTKILTQQDLFDEANGIRHFQTIDSDALFDMQLARRRYVVEGLLPEGLTLLTGDPKIGKSFFALSLSVSVAKGVPFLCFPTQKCGVLYFCFEDDVKRLQQRLFEMSEEAFPGLHFCQDILRLGEGFIESLSEYLTQHPDTKLVVVDTLNYIRPDKFSTNMYKSD
jgi:predicted ATP-dependent serine protease